MTQVMQQAALPEASPRTGKLRFLYVSRYAPIRTQTDPYTGLPWYLSRQTSLAGIWNTPERGAVAFKEVCEEITEVTGNVRGWLAKLYHVWRRTHATTKPDAILCGIDEHSLTIAILAGKTAGVAVYACAEDPPFTNRYDGSPSMGKRMERACRRRVIAALLRQCVGIFCFIEKEALRDFDVGGVPLHQMMNGPSEKALAWSRGSVRPAGQNGDFVVGLVGALCKEQGLGTLLEIFAKARERLGGLRLCLIGPMDPAYERAFYEELHRLKLDPAIEVTGWLPYQKMMEKLNGCSVGIYCNPDTEWYRVAQPLKICEYLGLAKPVVAWDYPGARRLLDHGRLGILVPPGDIAAFADALVTLKDPSLRAGIEHEIRTATASCWSSVHWYGEALKIMTEHIEGEHDHFSRR